MQPKVELAHIRNLGETVDDSIQFFKQNWNPLLKAFFVICGFFWLAGLVIAVLNQTQTFQLQDEGESAFSFSFFLAILINFINFTLIALTTLSFVALYHEKNKESPNVAEVWGYVKYYFFRIFGSSILLMILLALGFVCCIMPGIYFMPVMLLTLSVMVLENASIGYAFSRTFQLIKKNWWHTFGVLIVTMVLVAAATLLCIILVLLIAAIILLVTNADRDRTLLLAIKLIFSAIQPLYMLPIISIAFVYFSLNEQKDEYGLMQRIKMLGINNEDIDKLPAEEY